MSASQKTFVKTACLLRASTMALENLSKAEVPMCRLSYTHVLSILLFGNCPQSIGGTPFLFSGISKVRGQRYFEPRY